MASTTGELTSERLSLTVSSPATASRRACETELPGIHSAGRSPSSAGQLPMKPLTTWSDSAGLTSMATQRSPTGLAVSLNFLPSVEIWSEMDGSATTATASWPSTQRAEATLDRSDSASPKKRHRMNAATTTTTATRAPMTPTLMPRRPVVMARWLPVHSPPSHSPECCARGGVRGGGGGAAKDADSAAGRRYSCSGNSGSR